MSNDIKIELRASEPATFSVSLTIGEAKELQEALAEQIRKAEWCTSEPEFRVLRPDERIEEGDECLCGGSSKFRPSDCVGGSVSSSSGIKYRRRNPNYKQKS